jgi:hypothetical protein
VTRLDASISIDRLDQSEDETVEHERALKVPLPPTQNVVGMIDQPRGNVKVAVRVHVTPLTPNRTTLSALPRFINATSKIWCMCTNELTLCEVKGNLVSPVL